MAERMVTTTFQRASFSAWRRGARQRPWLLLLGSLPLLLVLLVPLLALVARVDLADLLTHLVEPAVAQAISLSLVTTALTTTIALVLGTPIAYLLARRRFPGRMLLDTLIDLPMVLPPSVAGIALLVAFGRRGLLGQYLVDVGISIAFTQAAVVLAQTFVAAPFYVKAAAAGFASVERELEQAAAIDGASSLRVFAAITLPLARPALLGGLVMTWARALGEFGATIIFAGNFPGRTQTMPLAIYLGFELDFSVALTLSVILLAASFGVLFIVKRLLGRSIGT
ncbi:MAG TPA: ABC transporter permease [Herpetosiphonaceae bacterium]